MIKQNISAGTESIKENIMVIRAKFKPLLEEASYLEDVDRLVEAVPHMLDNVEAMANELNNAYEILWSTPKED